MGLTSSSDEPNSDRDRLMKTACLVYLLAATDAHAKNFSFLYTRGKDRPGMRLAPLYDIASAWPYPRRIPPQKMKLAMRVGRYYRLQDIQLRHFKDLAKACSYPAELLLDTLRDLAERLPDEALGVIDTVGANETARQVLVALVDKVSAKCRQVARRFAAGQ